MGNRYNKLGWETQIKGLQLAVVPGAAAATNIALTGARKNKDTVLKAVDLTGFATITEVPVITADGFIQFPTFVSTAKNILILWDNTSD
jgi:hypothetical protein